MSNYKTKIEPISRCNQTRLTFTTTICLERQCRWRIHLILPVFELRRETRKPTQTLGEHSNSIQKHHQSAQARTASPPLTPFNQKDNIYCSSYLWLWDEGSSRDGEAVVDLAEILSHDGQTTPLSAACACRQPLE